MAAHEVVGPMAYVDGALFYAWALAASQTIMPITDSSCCRLDLHKLSLDLFYLDMSVELLESLSDTFRNWVPIRGAWIVIKLFYLQVLDTDRELDSNYVKSDMLFFLKD